MQRNVLEDPDFSDDPIFRGAGFPVNDMEQECPHCGTWFPPSGIEQHKESCPVRDSEELDYESVVRTTSKCVDCGYWGAVHRGDCSVHPVSLPDVTDESYRKMAFV